MTATVIPKYFPHPSSAIFTTLKSRKAALEYWKKGGHWKEHSGSRRQHRDHSPAAQKGLLLATDDVILPENFVGTSFVQMSRFGKLYGFP